MAKLLRLPLRPVLRPPVGPAIGPTLVKGGAYNLEAYLAELPSAGFWDFAKTDRHFQNVAVLADDIGEAISFALDQALWAKRTLDEQIAQAPEQLNQLTTGAVVGVIGAGGALPSGITRQTLAGITHEVVALLDDPIYGQGFRLRISGTNTSGATGFPGLIFRQIPYIADTLGALARYRIALKLHAGTLTVNPELQFNEFNSLNNYLTTTVIRSAPPTGTPTWFDGLGRAANANTAGVSPLMNMIVGNGVSLDQTFDIYMPSWRPITGFAGYQATGTAQPKRQADGAKFDGGDDNLLTQFKARSGSNFLAARVSVPATLGAEQVIAGLSGSGTDRLQLAIDTSGRVCAGVGSNSVTTHVGTTDLRGREVTVGVSVDGTTVKLFADAAEEYTGAQAGAPSTTVPLRLGANNNNGTASSFWAGAIKRLAGGHDALDLTQYQRVRSALAA